jgi:hypothetical protein
MSLNYKKLSESESKKIIFGIGVGIEIEKKFFGVGVGFRNQKV